MNTQLKTSLSILLWIGLFGCSSNEQAVSSMEQSVPAEIASEVFLTSDQLNGIGLELGFVDIRPMQTSVLANGRLHIPPQDKVQITSTMGGIARKSILIIGDQVKKGQVLAYLENPAFIELQEEYLQLVGMMKYHQAEFERQNRLRMDNINSEKALLEAEANFSATKAQYLGTAEKLKLLGVNLERLKDGKIIPLLVLRSPIDGYVTRVNTAQGTYIQPDEFLYEISDPDHLHVELAIFEKDIMLVKKGQPFIFRLPNQGPGVYTGVIHLVGRSFNEDRTVDVHGHIEPEKQGEFLEGMYVEAEIQISEQLLPAVPDRAILKDGETHYIFITANENDGGASFKRIAVERGTHSNGWVSIEPKDEVPEKFKVVTEGVYYLQAEMEKEDAT